MRDYPWCRLRELTDWLLEWADLCNGHVGLTDHHAKVIVLDKRLLQVEQRCTLAHELEHVGLGPAPSDRVMLAREEEWIEQTVARRLIPLDQLVAAVAWSRDPHEIAEELWVDVPTLEARARGLTAGERDVLRQVLGRV